MEFAGIQGAIMAIQMDQKWDGKPDNLEQQEREIAHWDAY